MSIKFEDNSMEVKEKLEEICMAWLYEAAGELTSQTQRNSKSDSGQTKGAWKYTVDEAKQVATVGNPLENAIWEEFGKNTCAELKLGKIGMVYYTISRNNIPISKAKLLNNHTN